MEDECICNADVKQEIEDVLIEFSTLHLAVIISTDLVSSVHATHVAVVDYDGFRTRDRDASAILLASEDCTCC